MASLLARMNIDSTPAGPVRNTKSASKRSSPYTRPSVLPSKNEGQWKHDLFESHHDLKSRLMSPNQIAEKALKDAFGPNRSAKHESLEIKGAAGQKTFNAVQVKGLTDGTTPEDVKTIFQRVGPISSAEFDSSTRKNNVVIRLTFKTPAHADVAVSKFNGQVADGRKLEVVKVGINSATGESFFDLMSNHGLDAVKMNGSVDSLFNSSDSGGSKMRSDALVNDAGSQVMIAPPGTNPADYRPAVASRGGRGRGRGRPRSNEPWSRGGGGRAGGRGGGGNLKNRMDLD
ncbi:hypothetical protein DL96DRAFT_1154254 [Flagelloscypha sp. PMI_526]|nr:hypothetical protein DL96DRAFT_1154254 [Flagelloscypha sp. PMI_526]